MDDSAKRSGGQLGEYAYSNRERSPGEIVKDIVENAQEIIRSEVRLAKAEVKEEGRKAVAAGISFGAGAVMALYAIGFVLAGLTALLARFMPWWGAALIMGVLLAVGAFVSFGAGKKKWSDVHPAPEKAIAEVKENVEWLKRQTK